MYRYFTEIVHIIKPEIFVTLNKTGVKSTDICIPKRFVVSSATKLNTCRDCIVKSQQKLNNYYKRYSFKNNYYSPPPRGLYLFGFMGFFESKEDKKEETFEDKIVMTIRRAILFIQNKEEEEEETIEDKILMTIKRAILAIQRDQIPKAENFLNKAFQMSDAEKLEDVKTQIIDIQANLCLQQGEYSRAESLFKIVAQRLVGQGKATVKDNSIVEISIKLSEIYKTTARYEEALSGYEYCANVQREKIEKEGMNDEDTLLLAAWALHGWGQMYISTPGTSSTERIEESMALIKAAYKYATDAVGFDSHQALAIRSDIATTLALLGDFDNALKTIQECAEIAKDKYDNLYATLEVNKGTLFLQKGDTIQAEQICQEAQIIANAANDPETIARAGECVQKAKDLRKKKDEEKTEMMKDVKVMINLK